MNIKDIPQDMSMHSALPKDQTDRRIREYARAGDIEAIVNGSAYIAEELAARYSRSDPQMKALLIEKGMQALRKTAELYSPESEKGFVQIAVHEIGMHIRNAAARYIAENAKKQT